jgi:hypothetical protein
MQWSDISFTPSQRTLRNFSGLWTVFFGGMAAWQYFQRGRPMVALALGAVALTVGLVGLVKPAALRWLYVGWMVLAFPIGWTVSRVLLAVAFYGVFTPLGYLLRLVGRDPLAVRFAPEQPTYWEPKPQAAGPGSYLRQF